MRQTRSLPRAVALACSTLLLLAACGGGGGAAAPTTAAAPTSAPAAAPTSAPAAPTAAPTTAPAAAATSAPTVAATTAPAAAPTAAATTAAAAAPTAAATTATTAATAAKGTIKIGVDLPMSGGEAANGVPTLNGVKLAVDQANQKGGVDGFKLEIESLDDAVNGVHDPAQGAKNVQTLIADSAVLAMVGPFNSNVAKAEIPLTNAAGLAQISPANTNEGLTKPEFGGLDLRKANPTKIAYFRVCTTDDIQGPAGADYEAKKLGFKKAYIVDDNETYGKGIADNWEKQFKTDGGTVLGHEHLTKDQKDFTALLTKIKGSGPDLLYYGGVTTTGGGLLRKQMKAIQLNIPLAGGDGIVEDEFLKEAADNADNSYGTVAAVNAETLPDAKDFVAAYKAAYNASVGAYSANAFEATNIIIAALDRAIKGASNALPTREQVRQEIANTKDFKGVIGTTSFDQNGDTTNKIISIYEVKGGKWAFLDQFNFGAQP